MGDKILEISKEELDDSLIEMLLESANESYSQGSFEDSLDYVRAILARYPSHTDARQALIRYLSEHLKRKASEISPPELDANLAELTQAFKVKPQIPLDEKTKSQLGDYVIGKIIDFDPWLFLSGSLSHEYRDAALSTFRRRACHYVAQEYSRYRPLMQPEDLRNRIDRILSALESKSEPFTVEPLVYVQELQLAPEGLQPGTLAAYITVCFILISLTFASRPYPEDLEQFVESLGRVTNQLENEGKFDQTELRRTETMIRKFMEGKP